MRGSRRELEGLLAVACEPRILSPLCAHRKKSRFDVSVVLMLTRPTFVRQNYP